MAERLLGGFVILMIALALYAVLAAAALAPVVQPVEKLAGDAQIGRGSVLTTGYYISQPFTSIGIGLPPYALAAGLRNDSPKVYVKPASLADVHSGRVVVLLDSATGDGTKWSPFAVRTVSGVAAFASALGVVLLAALIVAAWLYGVLRRAATRTGKSGPAGS